MQRFLGLILKTNRRVKDAIRFWLDSHGRERSVRWVWEYRKKRAFLVTQTKLLFTAKQQLIVCRAVVAEK